MDIQLKKHTVLHTSDWHLGHMLYKKRRDDEFAAFLDWLLSLMKDSAVDTLIIAGDIFDTPLPGASAQRLYYDFLGKLGRVGVRHVVITAGNHDSPTFLTAPAALLRNFSIYVTGLAPQNPEDEILVLRDASGEPELIVCAVPHLRERDLRTSAAGESRQEKERKLQEGLRRHYSAVAAAADAIRQKAGHDVPVIATGHLFAAGSQCSGDEHIHDLYVGGLGHVPVDIFGNVFDYVALGHIHRAQSVGGMDTRRYAGSPLPLGFGECSTHKSVTIARFNGRNAIIEQQPVPGFRHMERVFGSRRQILERIVQLAAQQPAVGETIWVEVKHDGTDAPLDLNQAVHDLAEGTHVEILCVKQTPHRNTADDEAESETMLDELDVEEMFKRCLVYNGVAAEEKDFYIDAFRQLLNEYNESQENE